MKAVSAYRIKGFMPQPDTPDIPIPEEKNNIC